MPEQKIHLPRLHPCQKAILNDPARFKVIACGRRFGKTRLAVHIACRDTINQKQVMYFAPNYRMCADFFKDC